MYFPLMVRMDGRLVTVIGGGEVAARKCRLFLDFGARVRAAAPEFDALFDELPEAERVCSEFDEALLSDADAVIAATDDRAINRRVSEYCRARRIPVNVVDDPELCSFTVPATVRRGELTLAVSTGGKSPATAAEIRRRLEEEFPAEWEERIGLLGRLREHYLHAGLSPEQRREKILETVSMTTPALRALAQSLKEKET